MYKYLSFDNCVILQNGTLSSVAIGGSPSFRSFNVVSLLRLKLNANEIEKTYIGQLASVRKDENVEPIANTLAVCKFRLIF